MEELMPLNCAVEEDSESPLDCKEIKPVNTKEISPEYLLEGYDAEAEAPIFRPAGAKN